MLRGMTCIPAPFQVPPSDIALDDVLDHAPRKQRVYRALEQRQVEMERSLRDERVVENGLLVSLAPAMRPVIVHSLHIHPALV